MELWARQGHSIKISWGFNRVCTASKSFTTREATTLGKSSMDLQSNPDFRWHGSSISIVFWGVQDLPKITVKGWQYCSPSSLPTGITRSKWETHQQELWCLKIHGRLAQCNSPFHGAGLGCDAYSLWPLADLYEVPCLLYNSISFTLL